MKRSEREEQKSAGWNRSKRINVIAIIIRCPVSLSTTRHRDIVIFASRTVSSFLPPSFEPSFTFTTFLRSGGDKAFRLITAWCLFSGLENVLCVGVWLFYRYGTFHVLRVVRYLVWFLWNIITVSYPGKYIVRLQEFLIFAFDGWNKFVFEI